MPLALCANRISAARMRSEASHRSARRIDAHHQRGEIVVERFVEQLAAMRSPPAVPGPGIAIDDLVRRR